MRKLKAAIWGVSLGLALLLTPATAVHAADEGNGNKTCDRYEICFRASTASDFDLNGDHMHTFYYTNWHHENEYLWGPWTHCCLLVMDNVNGFWNRDSTCRVQLWDYYYGWYVYADLSLGFRGDVGYEINNAHTRCGG